jgi:hypothetical protein
VNRQVLESSRFKVKLEAYGKQFGS